MTARTLATSEVNGTAIINHPPSISTMPLLHPTQTIALQHLDDVEEEDEEAEEADESDREHHTEMTPHGSFMSWRDGTTAPFLYRYSPHILEIQTTTGRGEIKLVASLTARSLVSPSSVVYSPPTPLHIKIHAVLEQKWKNIASLFILLKIREASKITSSSTTITPSSSTTYSLCVLDPIGLASHLIPLGHIIPFTVGHVAITCIPYQEIGATQSPPELHAFFFLSDPSSSRILVKRISPSKSVHDFCTIETGSIVSFLHAISPSDTLPSSASPRKSNNTALGFLFAGLSNGKTEVFRGDGKKFERALVIPASRPSIPVTSISYCSGGTITGLLCIIQHGRQGYNTTSSAKTNGLSLYSFDFKSSPKKVDLSQCFPPPLLSLKSQVLFASMHMDQDKHYAAILHEMGSVNRIDVVQVYDGRCQMVSDPSRSMFSTPHEAILAIHCGGRTLMVDVLLPSGLLKFSLGPSVSKPSRPLSAQEDQVRFSDWLSRSAVHFPYLREARNIILKNRQKLGGELFIDRLLSLITNDACSVYPPQNPAQLELLFKSIWNASIDGVLKHSLTLYLICDADAAHPSADRHSDEYASTHIFQSKYQSCIHGFWAMDHFDFDTAFTVLSDPSLDVSDWADKIVSTFLVEGRSIEAQSFANSCAPDTLSDEVKFHLAIVTMNLGKALTLAVADDDELTASRYRKIFRAFLNSKKHISQLLLHPFLGAEEEALVSFCLAKPLQSQSIFLVHYYIHRAQVAKAVLIYDKLSATHSQGWLDDRRDLRQLMLTARSSLTNAERKRIEVDFAKWEADGRQFDAPPMSPPTHHDTSVERMDVEEEEDESFSSPHPMPEERPISSELGVSFVSASSRSPARSVSRSPPRHPVITRSISPSPSASTRSRSQSPVIELPSSYALAAKRSPSPVSVRPMSPVLAASASPVRVEKADKRRLTSPEMSMVAVPVQNNSPARSVSSITRDKSAAPFPTGLQEMTRSPSPTGVQAMARSPSPLGVRDMSRSPSPRPSSSSAARVPPFSATAQSPVKLPSTTILRTSPIRPALRQHSPSRNLVKTVLFASSVAQLEKHENKDSDMSDAEKTSASAEQDTLPTFMRDEDNAPTELNYSLGGVGTAEVLSFATMNESAMEQPTSMAEDLSGTVSSEEVLGVGNILDAMETEEASVFEERKHVLVAESSVNVRGKSVSSRESSVSKVESSATIPPASLFGDLPDDIDGELIGGRLLRRRTPTASPPRQFASEPSATEEGEAVGRRNLRSRTPAASPPRPHANQQVQESLAASSTKVDVPVKTAKAESPVRRSPRAASSNTLTSILASSPIKPIVPDSDKRTSPKRYLNAPDTASKVKSALMGPALVNRSPFSPRKSTPRAAAATADNRLMTPPRKVAGQRKVNSPNFSSLRTGQIPTRTLTSRAVTRIRAEEVGLMDQSSSGGSDQQRPQLRNTPARMRAAKAATTDTGTPSITSSSTPSKRKSGPGAGTTLSISVLDGPASALRSRTASPAPVSATRVTRASSASATAAVTPKRRTGRKLFGNNQ